VVRTPDGVQFELGSGWATRRGRRRPRWAAGSPTGTATARPAACRALPLSCGSDPRS